MTKKTHLIYSIVSICAIIAYCGFLVKSSISPVDTIEETLPYEALSDEEVVNEPESEIPISPVSTLTPNVPYSPTEEVIEEATEKESELIGFSPLYPVEGTVTKTFSLSHSYNEQTKDWRAHSGIDISAAPTQSVVSCEDGCVTRVYEDPLWGNVIEIDHGEYISVYKNLSTLIMVKEGDSVKRGEKISGVGQTSITESGSAHLHFEIMHYGKSVDPLTLIN